MNAGNVLKLVGGSMIVYFAMAACSASTGSAGPSSDDGGAASSSGGSASSGGARGDGSGGILDALTDPVPEAAADSSQSGSRLKLNYVAGADGSKQVLGMHDSMLNVDCNFETMSDGNLHCAPSGATIGTYFSDAACSIPLAYAVGCASAAPSYAISTTTSGCTSALHVFPVTGSFTGSMVYTGGNGGGCTGSSTPMVFSFYTIGTEVSPSSFVQGTKQTEP